MKRVGIYGSCVSRDTFEFLSHPELQLDFYIARQSLASVSDTRVPNGYSLDSLKSPFQRRMVLGDLQKSALTSIVSAAESLDLLLVDLVDERLGFYTFEDGSTATRSAEFEQSGVLKQLGPHKFVPFGTAEHLDYFALGLQRLMDALETSGLNEKTLVLAPAFAGQPQPSSPAILGKDWLPKDAEKFNMRYQPYYDCVIDSGLAITCLKPDEVWLDANHKWGLATYHFARPVYTQLGASVLEQIQL